jgi:hypothetical protein
VESTDLVALYDPDDGRVAHMHQVITLQGADPRSREENERRAFDAARQLGNSIEGLKALHVPDFLPQGSAYRVDLERRMLVEVESTAASTETS